ncbi:sigma 54-interacting transcriptional regulator [Alloacidobacterium dinghuense]|uniref:Sigma 54-interacting transcriptional regulator n=1 Tax=Alloacidobacterium dinghuense TaxID=2763107 RepID=A0A7G8BKR5_9BACT|nr:sigma 54-interacting transcriptional regulator [Alloacidobacterium dinghuense]QNI33135.1 sigma 54-interacting transcriptional regulator [Alloacidobacterium dinghuense]
MRILYLEDEPKDAELVQASMEVEDIVCDLTLVDTEADFLRSLKQGGGFDLILADYTLPSFDGISALKIAQDICPDVPFIFVSGTLVEEVGIEALKQGATDYVSKTRLSRIAPSVRRALREADERSQRKVAEEALQRSEAYLAEAQRLSHTGSFSWKVLSGEIYWSEETFRIFGFEQDVRPSLERILQQTHPADREHHRLVLESAAKEKKDFDFEHRLLMADASVKHIHVVGHRSKQTVSGELEFVGAVTDITERKRTEAELRNALDEIGKLQERLYKENIALREEIDKTFMFEEIVGESPALRTALAQVSKVAPTDATVLITGETGTGKELFARAIHKRSKRSSRAFVNVNCAAIPTSLIASELFGHEKGAFTGALQRRLGRFELAEGGTIFLDEVGELPLETQITLLRVLQEREFERVGGTQTVRADVRVIAATNRNLQSAIASGAFRSDLFYRLNVFPLQIPPLREREEDIPLLVEYFIDRYARKANKKIRTIEKRTLDLLQSYSWPGNIRELQNVIERSIVLCETDTFSMEQGWLCPTSSSQLDRDLPNYSLTRHSAEEERKIIEAALAQTRGRISGPDGAAAQLGMPASTLESKIRALKINKHQFKTA